MHAYIFFSSILCFCTLSAAPWKYLSSPSFILLSSQLKDSWPELKFLQSVYGYFSISRSVANRPRVPFSKICHFEEIRSCNFSFCRDHQNIREKRVRRIFLVLTKMTNWFSLIKKFLGGQILSSGSCLVRFLCFTFMWGECSGSTFEI